MERRNSYMRTVIKRSSLLLVMLISLMYSPTAHATYDSVKVVFSGTGVGNFPTARGGSSAFSFWVGCAASSGPPGALSPYFMSPCAGTMAVYGLQLTRQVIGSFIQGTDGAYLISVHSLDGAIVASLTNTPTVTGGPTNTVTVAFSSPSGGGSTTNAV